MTEFQTHMCPACAAGFPEECSNPKYIDIEGSEDIIPCSVEFTQLISVGGPKEKGNPGRPTLGPGEVTDPKSTGRKRAAMLAPILTGQVCGWANLRHAGGGVVPILGCNGHQLIEKKGGDEEQGFWQGDRHHGPDKNTLNNSVGMNLHSICVDCHHRWHALNDRFYDEDGRPSAEFAFVPVEGYYLHDPLTTFTDEEFELAEAWWDLPVKERGAYPFSPPEDTRKVLPTTEDPATLDPGENPFPDSPFSEIGDSA